MRHKIIERNESAELVNCQLCGWVVGITRAKGRKLSCSLAAKEQRGMRWNNRAEGSTTIRDGYVFVQVGGRWRRQHRVIMEEKLGRTLLPHENVHHINGDRADNRLENLELWSSSQPPGQRVRDKIAHAKMILDLYGTQENAY